MQPVSFTLEADDFAVFVVASRAARLSLRLADVAQQIFRWFLVAIGVYVAIHIAQEIAQERDSLKRNTGSLFCS